MEFPFLEYLIGTNKVKNNMFTSDEPEKKTLEENILIFEQKSPGNGNEDRESRTMLKNRSNVI